MGERTLPAQLLDDARVPMAAEAESAPLFRHHHSKEAVLADVLPDLGRKVLVLLDLVLVEHLAQDLGLVVEKRLLLRRQLDVVGADQLLEFQVACE